jgi:hypothetical protein
MEDSNDEIGKLFKAAFEGHKTPPTNEEWEVLGSSLTKHNFFKFNPYQFNIYYAGTIVICFLICVGVGSHYGYKNFVEPSFTQTIEIQTTISSEDSTAYLITENPVKTQNEGQKKESRDNPKGEQISERKETTLLIEQTSSARLTPVTKRVDSSNQALQRKEHSSKVDSLSHPLKPAKRTLYITKRDTIFRFDTIKTQKKQRKWLR